LDSQGAGRCTATNINGLPCHKKGAYSFEGAEYCKGHQRQLERERTKAHSLRLPFPPHQSESEISKGLPWVAAIFEDNFVPELSMYAVDIIVESQRGVRPSGVWPFQRPHRWAWLWGPDLETAQRTALRFNEDRGYNVDSIKEIYASAGLPKPTLAPDRRMRTSFDKTDLAALDATNALVCFYGNNDRFFWANTAMYKAQGLRSLGDLQSWSRRIHPHDLAAAYEARGKALSASEPHVTDVRIRYHENEGYRLVRFTSHPIFDPITRDFLFRSSVGVGFDQLEAAATVQQQIKALIDVRCHRRHRMEVLDANWVAFVPREEKVSGFGYRLAYAEPGREGYQLFGLYPYLPTPGYFPPIFLGPNYDAATAAADRFNESRGITRETSLRILHKYLMK
jgi:PAS domain-containing protein